MKSPRVEEQQFPAKASFSYSHQDFVDRETVISLKALEEVNAAPVMLQGCQGYVAPFPTLGRNLDSAGPTQAAFSPPK